MAFDLRCPATSREREVLGYLKFGLTNKEIGNALGITEGTVKNHMRSLMRKYGAQSRVELALISAGVETWLQ